MASSVTSLVTAVPDTTHLFPSSLSSKLPRSVRNQGPKAGSTFCTAPCGVQKVVQNSEHDLKDGWRVPDTVLSHFQHLTVQPSTFDPPLGTKGHED